MGWKGGLVELPVMLLGCFARRKELNLNRPSRIAVIRPNDLGDLLTTTPVFAALKGRFPFSRICGVVGSWGLPVLANNPNLDEVIALDAPWNNKVVQDQSWAAILQFLRNDPTIKSLRDRGGFDVGIDVLGSHVGAVLMMRLGCRYRVGVRGYRGGWSGCEKYIRFSKDRHVARAALVQAGLLGVTDLPEPRPQLFLTDAERADAAGIWGTRDGRARLLVGCGGGLPEKVWPSAALGDALLRLNATASTIDILIVGGPSDRDRATAVLAQAGPGVRSVCGQSSLRTTFALTEASDFVLTNPSMLLHVAAAFHRPTVAVLGGMYGNAREHDALWGYPHPYRSVAPLNGETWPSVERVVDAMKAALQ